MYSNEDLIINILKLIAEEGLTAKEFAQKIGRKPGIITDWKSNRSSPTISDLVVICTTFNCSVENLIPDFALISDENYDLKFMKLFSSLSEKNKEKVLCFMEIANMDPSISYKHEKEQISDHVVKEESVYSTAIQIPVLGKVAAGTPILSYSSDFGTIIPENKTASYALIVQGDSMYPVILDKEYIEVTSQPDLEQGEIGIIMVDGDVTCKKFYNFKDHYELRSLNPDYATITVPKTSSTNLQILGKVSLTEAQMKRF